MYAEDETPGVDDHREQHTREKLPTACIFMYIKIFTDHFVQIAMRSLYFLFLLRYINFEERIARLITHLNMTLAYLSTFVGASVTSYFGSYRMVATASLATTIGYAFLFGSSFAFEQIRVFSIIPFIIYYGTRGLSKTGLYALAKSALRKDPEKEQYYLTHLYLSTAVASITSSLLIPVFKYIPCFGRETCYELCFGICFLMILIGTVAFLVGTKYYKRDIDSSIFIVVFLKCVIETIWSKLQKSQSDSEEEEDSGSKEYIVDTEDEIKSTMRNFYDVFPLLIPIPMFWALYDQQVTLSLLIPIPMFWALYDQQATLFMLQAEVMYTKVYEFYIYPEWIFVLLPTCSLLLIPFFMFVLTPLMDKVKIFKNVVNRIFLGLLLGAISYAIATFLEAYIEPSRLDPPVEGKLYIFNGSNCTVQLTIYTDVEEVLKTVQPRKYIVLYENRTSLHVIETEIEASCAANTFKKTYNLIISETMVYTHMIIIRPGAVDVVGPYESIVKKHHISAYVRVLYSIHSTKSLRFVGPETKEFFLVQEGHFLPDFILKEGQYDIIVDGALMKSKVKFGVGGIYTTIIQEDQHLESEVYTFTQPNIISIFWIVPQIILLTIGEILISNNCIGYLVIRTSPDMKIIISALWLLTVAIGNSIVLIDVTINLCCNRKLYIFLQYTAFMILNSIVHLFIATPYY